MGKGYSKDLRERVAAFVDGGQSRHEAARHFTVSPSFAVKLLQLREETGSLEPRQQGRPRGGGKLAPHKDFLIGVVKAEPDITMPALYAFGEGRGFARFCNDCGSFTHFIGLTLSRI